MNSDKRLCVVSKIQFITEFTLEDFISYRVQQELCKINFGITIRESLTLLKQKNK